MVDTLRYKDWIDKAERDIKSAKVLKEHEYGNDVVAFHSQELVEKNDKSIEALMDEVIFENEEALKELSK